MIAATGLPGRRWATCRSSGFVTVNDGRVPALTPFWESVTLPRVYFAGNASQGEPRACGKRGAGASSTSVNGFRYNARVLARHLAEQLKRTTGADARRRWIDVVPFLLRELTSAPELWVQKGYLCRVVTGEDGGFVDDGVVPLAHFLDAGGGGRGRGERGGRRAGQIVPTVYVRRGGEIAEHRSSRIRCTSTEASPTAVNSRPCSRRSG